MPREIIEIGGHTQSPLGLRLSNFHRRSFVFDGIVCASFEGFIQSLKCPDLKKQKEICFLSGKDAKKAGLEYNNWTKGGFLFWQGTMYRRTSRDYMLLIQRVYDAIYEQNEEFREDLRKVGEASLWHSIGNPDMSNTTLTEVEMLWNIERLVRRALTEAMRADSNMKKDLQ